MAYCPKCGGLIETAAVECPHCGYSWPVSARDVASEGWEYSTFAVWALILASIVAAIACVVIAVGGAFALLHRRWLEGGVIAPALLLNQLGLLIVFMRVGGRLNR